MKMIDHQCRVRQQSRRADRFRVDGSRIDRDVLGIEGVRRGKRVADPPAPPPARIGTLTWSDEISPPPRRNQLWVTDLTHVATWAGIAYVCFIADAYSRMIVGLARRTTYAN